MLDVNLGVGLLELAIQLGTVEHRQEVALVHQLAFLDRNRAENGRLEGNVDVRLGMHLDQARLPDAGHGQRHKEEGQHDARQDEGADGDVAWFHVR